MLVPDSDQSRVNLQQIADRYADHTDLVTSVDNAQIQAISGLALEAQQGLFFPNLGWIPPRDFCQALLDENNIPLLNADITQIERDSNNHHWVLKDSKYIIASAQTWLLPVPMNL